MRKREVVIVIVVVSCTLLVALLHVATGVRQRAFETEWSVPSAVPVAVDPPTPQKVADNESVPAGGQESISKPESDQNDTSEETSSQSAHLARMLTREERFRHFDARATKGLDRVFMKVYIAGLKRVESAIWLVRPDLAKGFTADIGIESLGVGDVDAARDYLREAIPHLEDGFRRSYLKGSLAWLEDDPRVAERLLEQSCADNKPRLLWNAVELTSETGSDQLREDYANRIIQLPIDEEDERGRLLQDWARECLGRPSIGTRRNQFLESETPTALRNGADVSAGNISP